MQETPAQSPVAQQQPACVWEGLKQSLRKSFTLVRRSGKPPLHQSRSSSLMTTPRDSLAASPAQVASGGPFGASTRHVAWPVAQQSGVGPEVIERDTNPEHFASSSLPGQAFGRSKSAGARVGQPPPERDAEAAASGGPDGAAAAATTAAARAVKALLPFVPRLLSSDLAAAAPRHPSLAALAELHQADTAASVAKVELPSTVRHYYHITTPDTTPQYTAPMRARTV